MKHIKDIYPVVQQVRQRIIETMQERGLTKVDIIPSREDYDKEHKDDPDYEEFGWDDLKSYTCPAITFVNKHSMILSYDVISVELDMNDGNPRFKLNCEGEFDNDWFYDYDVSGMQGVYEAMESELGLDEEPEYVWVFVADQVSDDETFDVITEVFATEEAARQHLHDFVYGEEGELAYAEKRGWVVEHNEPDLFRSYEDGYYSGNHTEATIEKREVKH